MNARIRRIQLRNGAFHITGRTQGCEPWFVPELRRNICSIITGELSRTDAKLIAFAIMPNHFHVILVQGSITLGRLMQPVLRRIALRVQRRHGITGHVFERRFYSGLLQTPDHLREAIVYTHRNPMKAGLCGSVKEYEWTSHAAYVAGDCEWKDYVDVETGLRVFGDAAECDVHACRHEYLRWMERRDQELSLEVQLCEEGNKYFYSRFATMHEPQYPGRDLRDVALKALSFITNDYELQDLRCSFLSHRAASVRRKIIAFLLISGYRTGQISQLFAVAPSTVSKVANQLKSSGRGGRFVSGGDSAGFPFSPLREKGKPAPLLSPA